MTDETVLGKQVDYITTYTPSLLQTVSRAEQRESLGIIAEDLPFRGADLWNAYDFTWLSGKGKPEVGVAQFEAPAKATRMVEAKSVKLYLGSFTQTKFASRNEVMKTLESDLTIAVQAPVSVALSTPEHIAQAGLGALTGQCIDNLDVEVEDYYWNPDHLEIASDVIVREALYSNLLRTLCPVTGQPDMGSILIQYSGRSIDTAGLLKYLISYREHPEFSEQIVERVFVDIMNRCEPDRLTVYARYARRGGIDINPFRTNEDRFGTEVRMWRQ